MQTPPTAGANRDSDLEGAAIHALGDGITAPAQGHPGGLYLLFATEMWERFSYYGMKAFLTLYMAAAVTTGGLGWTKEKTTSVYGWYTGLVYLTPIAGGYIADKLLGTHYSMLIGGLIIACGHFSLAFDSLPTFYLGLALIVVGTGFFKPCVSVMVSQLYKERDPRRDAAFTIFYMGINLGAFFGPIVCGGLRVGRKHGEVFGWSWAFAAAGVGMVLGLIAYLIGRPFLLRGIGLPPRRAAASASGAAVKVRAPLTREEKDGIIAIFAMAFFVIFFWTAFEQAGSSMNFFAEERTDRSMSHGLTQTLYDIGTEPSYPAPWWMIGIAGLALLAAWIGFERASLKERVGKLATIAIRIVGLAIGPALMIFALLKPTGFLQEAFFPPTFVTDAQYPAEWFQSVNPFCILVFAPIFASLWVKLARQGREPSTPVKFALGLILLGVGFIFMVLGAQASETGGPQAFARVSGWWLMGAYTVHTLGELCLSPVGLSAVNKLSPTHLVSLLMGVWFLANFVANKLAAFLAGYADQIAKKTLDLGPLHLKGQGLFYSMFVAAPITAGIVLLIISPWLKRLMHGRA